MGLRILLVVSMIGLWFVMSPTSTFACKCGPPGTPEEKLDQSALVFRGTVTSIGSHDQQGWLTVIFDVATVWKGPDSQAFTLFTPEDSAACGYPFEDGVEFVVYSWDGVDIGRCGRTAPVELAGEDLAAFDGPVQTVGDSGFPNSGNGGLADADSGQDRLGAMVVIGVATALMLGFAGLRLYDRRQATRQGATNVDCT